MVNGEVQLQALLDKKKLTLMGYGKLSQKLTSYKAFFSPQWKFLTHIILQCLCAKTTRKQKSRKSKKKNIGVPRLSGSTENVPDENVPTTSNDPLLSGENRLKLTELMDLYTNLQKKVLDLEKAKTAQDSEIASLKKEARRVESFDEASLGDQEDASKQGRKIADIDADAEVTFVDRNNA
ncbi:hypothetical protein Tco_1460865 [Tanacetum coccineum]